MDESPIIVPQITFQVHARHRDPAIEYADRLGREILSLIGGEPWVMVDDDFKRLHPMPPVTIADDQGFLYMGVRGYSFNGPFLGTLEAGQRDGYRTQNDTGRPGP